MVLKNTNVGWQVSELTAEKERLQAEVQRQRASLSKNRVRATTGPLLTVLLSLMHCNTVRSSS